MNVSVIGLGYIGCATVALLARLGHTTIGVDVECQSASPANTELSLKSSSRLDKLIDQAANLGRFRRTADVRSAVMESEVSLVCVPASNNANGSQNLRELDRVFRQIGTALARKREYHLIIVRSTVLPGTTEGRFSLLLQHHSGRRAGPDFGLCAHPALSWAASGIEDIEHAPHIVIGELDPRSGDSAQQLYTGVDVPVIRTTIQAAEMLNYVSSAFHAVEITFANEIRSLCATHGIDGQEVIEHLCQDQQPNISSADFSPGFSLGGPHFIRDLRALLHRAKEQDVDCPLLSAVLPSNQRQISRAIELVEKTHRSKIGILGLGTKAEAADIRENPIIHLAEMLAGKGYRVRIFDENIQVPNTSETEGVTHTPVARHNISRLVCHCLEEVIHDSEVVVLASRDSAISNLFDLLSDNQILIDLNGAARQPSATPAKRYATS
jgi:GDP-mannose 6-dehydrogenase